MLHCGIIWWDESMERGGVVDYMYFASIWAINNLAGIVISVKILGLKFLPYIDWLNVHLLSPYFYYRIVLEKVYQKLTNSIVFKKSVLIGTISAVFVFIGGKKRAS